MCFPTWHMEAIRSRAARLALAERYLDIDISLDSFEDWEHGYPTVGPAGRAAPWAGGCRVPAARRTGQLGWVCCLVANSRAALHALL